MAYSIGLYGMSLQLACLALILSLVLPSARALSAPLESPMRACDIAAEQAAREHDVPVLILKALTRTETGTERGGQFGPWAWTVNMQGKGFWFDSLDAARTFIFRRFKSGARSFDVGCFQINYRWHHQEFASIDQMLEPLANARYAAQFLTRLKDELGTWEKAVGAYHSRTPKHARRYSKAFRKHLAQVRQQNTQFAEARPQAHTPRINRYPLLRPVGTSGAAGSLVSFHDEAAPGLLRRALPLLEGQN